MLHDVGLVLQHVDVAGLHARVAALVQVQDVAVGEGELGRAVLGSDDQQALVLRLAHDVMRALKGHLLDRGVERRRRRRS